jgi:hypothetical protein
LETRSWQEKPKVLIEGDTPALFPYDKEIVQADEWYEPGNITDRRRTQSREPTSYSPFETTVTLFVQQQRETVANSYTYDEQWQEKVHKRIEKDLEETRKLRDRAGSSVITKERKRRIL